MSEEPHAAAARSRAVLGRPPGPAAWAETGAEVEQIVATGIEFGDSQGFEAISLQKIAAQLGVSTNAMYRYVSSKDELIVLVADKAAGRPPAYILAASGWRQGSSAWVKAQVDLYAERPWLLDVPIRGAPVTPNLLHWVETLLAVTGRYRPEPARHPRLRGAARRVRPQLREPCPPTRPPAIRRRSSPARSASSSSPG